MDLNLSGGGVHGEVDVPATSLFSAFPMIPVLSVRKRGVGHICHPRN